MVEIFLTLMDLLLNILTLGGWGRSQGAKSSDVTHISHIDERDVTLHTGSRQGTNFKDRR